MSGTSDSPRSAVADAATTRPHVHLDAPLRLVSQAVAQALRSRGVDAEAVAPATPVARCTAGAIGVLFLVDDRETTADARGAVRLLVERHGRVLVLTSRSSEWYWGALLASGASSVLSSSASLDEVEATVLALHRGEPAFDAEERSRLIARWRCYQHDQDELAGRWQRLSPRELRVLAGLSAGSPVTELADRFGVAETTVRSQVKSILRKLGVRSQLAAISLARRLDTPPVRVRSHPRGAPRRIGADRAAD